MKKTMLALMATVGLAFGAKADGAVLNSTGFEYATFGVDRNDSGEPALPFMWSAATTNGSEATSLACAVTNYADAASKPTNLPEEFVTAGDKYLAVDTSGEVLYRNVNAREGNSYELGEAEPIGKGLYFDANVQFTASDGEPTYDSADKLVVWLRATEGENPTTNLVVTAGVWNNGEGKYDPYNFEIDGTYSADTWYRLTVKAASVLSEDTENNTAAFEVYIDDSKIFSGETSVFYSMVQPGTSAATTLTAVGFQGTGAVDNLVWTTEDPFPPEGTYTLALTDADFAYSVTVDNNPVADITSISEDFVVSKTSVAVVVNVGPEDGTFAATTENAGVVISTPAPSTKEVQEEEELVTYYLYSFTVTIAEPAADAKYSVALAFEPAGSGDEPAQVVPGTPAEVEAESAEAAVAKAEKVIPEAVKTAVGAGGETYLSYFELVATETETPGTYNVEMKLTTEAKASLEEDADDGVEDLLDAVNALTGEETKASANVTVPAGFYWALSSGTTLEGMANDAGNTPSAGTVNLSVTKETDDTAGFYQLLISPTPIPSTKE